MDNTAFKLHYEKAIILHLNFINSLEMTIIKLITKCMYDG